MFIITDGLGVGPRRVSVVPKILAPLATVAQTSGIPRDVTQSGNIPVLSRT